MAGAFAVNIETAHEPAFARLIASHPLVEVNVSGAQLDTTSTSLSSVDLQPMPESRQADETVLSWGELKGTEFLRELLA